MQSLSSNEKVPDSVGRQINVICALRVGFSLLSGHSTDICPLGLPHISTMLEEKASRRQRGQDSC